MLAAFASIALPVIGMVHLPPLPGSPGYGGRLDAVREAMLADAQALAAGGVHGLMIENFGDSPFYPRRVPAHVIAHMTALAAMLRERIDLPLGINVLRNDGRAALAIAHAVGAAFIRVNVLCGARVTDQGIVEGIAHHLLRDRAQLDAGDIKIMADVNVKHSAALAPRPIAAEVADTVGRGGADAVIVSGSATGEPIDMAELDTVRAAAGETGVWIGSGATVDNLASLRGKAAGLIVGSALKVDGRVNQRVDPQRVRRFMQAVG
jgi:hypothetical protein